MPDPGHDRCVMADPDKDPRSHSLPVLHHNPEWNFAKDRRFRPLAAEAATGDKIGPGYYKTQTCFPDPGGPGHIRSQDMDMRTWSLGYSYGTGFNVDAFSRRGPAEEAPRHRCCGSHCGSWNMSGLFYATNRKQQYLSQGKGAR